MPAVLDTHALMDPAEIHTLHKPQHHSALRSFWSTLFQSLRRAHVRHFEQTSRVYGPRAYPVENSADHLARQSPKLYLQAFAGAC